MLVVPRSKSMNSKIYYWIRYIQDSWNIKNALILISLNLCRDAHIYRRWQHISVLLLRITHYAGVSRKWAHKKLLPDTNHFLPHIHEKQKIKIQCTCVNIVNYWKSPRRYRLWSCVSYVEECISGAVSQRHGQVSYNVIR